MNFFISLILFLGLTSSWTFAATDDQIIFLGNFIQLHCATSLDSTSLNDRFSQVITHQNQLRKQKNIPLLNEKPALNFSDNKFSYFIDTPNAFPDDPIAGLFIVHGNLIIRGVYNDLFSLNYVYEFNGSRLVKIESYGIWYLNHHSEQTIALYRKMSPKEYELWKNGRFDSLGAEWGYKNSVIHFSTDKNFTSSASPPNFPKIEILIPKKILFEGLKNDTIWSGILNEKSMISEFVISSNVIKDILTKGSIQFLD